MESRETPDKSRNPVSASVDSGQRNYFCSGWQFLQTCMTDLRAEIVKSSALCGTSLIFYITSPSLMESHTREDRKDARAGGSGRHLWNCLQGLTQPLHAWTHGAVMICTRLYPPTPTHRVGRAHPSMKISTVNGCWGEGIFFSGVVAASKLPMLLLMTPHPYPSKQL